MVITDTRFGSITIEEQDVLTFADGMVGFVEVTQFVLLNLGDNSPFRWLQSVQRPELAFLLADPDRYVDGYHPLLQPADCQELSIQSESPYLIFVTANIPRGKPQDLTLNLAAPVVINPNKRLGKQVVLEDQAYTVRHRVFAQTKIEEMPIAA